MEPITPPPSADNAIARILLKRMLQHLKESLQSSTAIRYTYSEIRLWNVALEDMQFDGEGNPDPGKIFFDPLPQQFLDEHPIVKKYSTSIFNREDMAGWEPYHQADMVCDYILANFVRVDREGLVEEGEKLGDYTTMRLMYDGLHGWLEFDERMFSSLPKYTISDMETQQWETRAVWSLEFCCPEIDAEYPDSDMDSFDQETRVVYYPHVLLLTIHDTEAPEGGLLHGELAPIVQAMLHQVQDSGHDYQTRYPVMMYSMMGLHARILHASYSENRNKIVIRVSEMFSFEKEDTAPLDLFLRFFVSEPVVQE